MTPAWDELNVPLEYVAGTMAVWLAEQADAGWRVDRRGVRLYGLFAIEPSRHEGGPVKLALISCRFDVLVDDDDPSWGDPASDLGVLLEGRGRPTHEVRRHLSARLAEVALHEWAPGRCRVAFVERPAILARFAEVGTLLDGLRAFLRESYRAVVPAADTPPPPAPTGDLEKLRTLYEDADGRAKRRSDNRAAARELEVSPSTIDRLRRQLRKRGLL
jgi:hypothetical protein